MISFRSSADERVVMVSKASDSVNPASKENFLLALVEAGGRGGFELADEPPAFFISHGFLLKFDECGSSAP